MLLQCVVNELFRMIDVVTPHLDVNVKSTYHPSPSRQFRGPLRCAFGCLSNLDHTLVQWVCQNVNIAALHAILATYRV